MTHNCFGVGEMYNEKADMWMRFYAGNFVYVSKNN